jgi:dihydrofolate reductase
MSKVFDNIGLSLDGYMAPEGKNMGRPSTRTGVRSGVRSWGQGEVAWPEEAPFHTPVYVLTHEKREPWVRPGGTTFHFVNDGPERALERAREAAGVRDVRIGGGADIIQQYLNLGVVDELEIAMGSVLFGGGRRLFENMREPTPQFRIDRVVDTPDATHLRYVRQ